MIVFLIGFMGSGKSHLTQQLSITNGFSVFDLDHEIEINEGKTINEIFEIHGEAYFRDIEASVLRNLTNKLLLSESQVFENQHNKGNFVFVACGGGTPCFKNNMSWMNEEGLTVWLNPSTEILLARLAKDKAMRPLLKGLNEVEIESFINLKLLERMPFYEQSIITIKDSPLSSELFLKLITHA
jgi:shikimate kinase